MQIETKRRISNAAVFSAVVVALLMSVTTELVLRQVRTEEIQEAGEIQQNALKLFWELVKMKGALRVQDGRLWAGDYLLNGNNELPDKVREITGSHATVFQGDTRVATNVLQADGRRAIGTRLSGPAHDAIILKGIPFRGETEILGGTYYTAYDPIRAADGRVIGGLFVGSRQSQYLAAYNRTAFRIRLINGTLTCIFILCAFLLLDERKRSQDAIQKQLLFLQTVIDAIPSPVFYKNARGQYLGFNKSYEEMLGLTREQMLGKTVHDLWEKELADRYRQMDQELFDSSGTQVYESQLRYADGTLREVIFSKAVFKTPQGELGGLVGVIVDITERKAAEDQARDAYRRIADILEFLPDATFVVDQGGCVIAWNRAIETMTGVPKGEILGQGDRAYALPFYGERRNILIDLLDEDAGEKPHCYPGMAREGSSVYAEKKVILRGTEERYLWGVAAPLYDRQGNRVGGIQTLRDMTELRRAEQERSNLEAQLQHSAIMKSLMVQLGHDLKTPLTPLFALLPLVRGAVQDPKLGKMLEICQNCAGQIQGLTVKAMDLVRLSGRQATPHLVPVALAEVAQRAVQESAALFSRRGISCQNSIDPGLSVRGAEEQLALLFDNLLSNAARFAAERGSVRIAASRQDATVLVSVNDDGIGLDPSHRNLIFGEFFKADEARHDLGTQGLGLAISRSIVLNHGGRIWAESPGRDQGTTIYFTLQPAEAA